MSTWPKGRKRSATVSVSGWALLKSPWTAYYRTARSSSLLLPPAPHRHAGGLLGLLFTAKKGS